MSRTYYLRELILALFIFLHFSVAFGEQTTTYCAPLFGLTNERLAQIKDELDHNLAHRDEVLDKLKIDPTNMTSIGLLGSGFSGRVFEVEIDGTHYALKLITDPHSRTSCPSPNEFREVDDAIIIQKALGEAGLAPQVLGIIEKAKIRQWLEVHPVNRSSLPVVLGLLMELVSPHTLKRRDPTHFVSSTHKRQLFRDAEDAERVLNTLGISAMDADGVVTPEGRLKLIDIAWYARGKTWGLFFALQSLIAARVQ